MQQPTTPISNSDFPYHCKDCGLGYPTPKQVRAHYKEEHMPRTPKPQKANLRCTYPKPMVHDCNQVCAEHNHECRYKAKGLSALKRHYLTHLPKEQKPIGTQTSIVIQ